MVFIHTSAGVLKESRMMVGGGSEISDQGKKDVGGEVVAQKLKLFPSSVNVRGP